MNREIDLSVSAYGVTRPLDYDVVILPWGATEPHNLHLPYLTDAILAHDVAVDACRLPTLIISSNARRKCLIFIIIYFDQSSSQTS